MDPDWSEYWDFCLENTLKRGKIHVADKEKAADSTNHSKWSKEDYDEEEHNCFAFVLNFLKSLKQDPFSSEACQKLEFCRKYILPKTTLAGKYICLYRKIKNSQNGGQKCVVGSSETSGCFVLDTHLGDTSSRGMESSDSSLEGKLIIPQPAFPNHENLV